MRLDARQGDTGWDVFDVPRCRSVPNVVAVDDESAELEVVDMPMRPGPGGCVATRVERAKRIAILPHQRLVLIDPVDDLGQEPSALTVEDVAWG
jgi:hypothetical protein